MAMAPRFKVYSADEYVASFKYPDHAAVLVSAIGGTIRLGHNRVVWDEGNEIQSANESYDFVAETVYGRISE